MFINAFVCRLLIALPLQHEFSHYIYVRAPVTVLKPHSERAKVNIRFEFVEVFGALEVGGLLGVASQPTCRFRY